MNEMLIEIIISLDYCYTKFLFVSVLAVKQNDRRAGWCSWYNWNECRTNCHNFFVFTYESSFHHRFDSSTKLSFSVRKHQFLILSQTFCIVVFIFKNFNFLLILSQIFSGNFHIIYCIYTVRKLRTVANSFLFSLAIADFIVG